MAKKKAAEPAKSSHPSALRWGKMTIAEIEQELETVQAIVDRLKGTCAAAKRAHIDSLNLDGLTKLPRGIELLAQFASNVGASFLKTK